MKGKPLEGWEFCPFKTSFLSVSVVKDLPFVRGFLLTFFWDCYKLGAVLNVSAWIQSLMIRPTDWPTGRDIQPPLFHRKELKGERRLMATQESKFEPIRGLCYLSLINMILVEHNLESCLDMNSLIV